MPDRNRIAQTIACIAEQLLRARIVTMQHVGISKILALLWGCHGSDESLDPTVLCISDRPTVTAIIQAVSLLTALTE